MLLLSVDFGTSSLKAAVMDTKERVLSTYKQSYVLHTTSDEHVQINALEIWNSFEMVLKKAFIAHPYIEGICFDAFAPSVLLFNDDGEPLTPVITHLDRRSRDQSKEIIALLPNYLSITGVLPYSGGVSATTLLWLNQHVPSLVKNAYRFGHLTTFIFHRLTGCWGMDGVNASMTGLFRTFQGGWDIGILNKLGISPQLCPDIIEPWDAPLPLLGSYAHGLGVKHEIKVWMGTQDVSAAQVGAGNTCSGDLLITSGSSEMLSLLNANPKPCTEYYTRRAACPGLWQLFAIGIGGFALEWFHNVFCSEMTEKDFYESYFPSVLLKNNKVDVEFMPYLAGDRHSMEIKHGSFVNLTLGTNRDDMLLAVIYGLQMPCKSIFNIWKKNGIGLNNDVKITGNLARSDAYLKFKMDLWPSLHLHRVEDSPLIGNVRLTCAKYNKCNSL